MNLEERAINLERRLEGDDRRTVHQLLLVMIAFNGVKEHFDDADELYETLDYIDDYEDE